MEQQTEQKESIKLMKMSKGYQWEIKIIPGDSEFPLHITNTDLERLKRLNDLIIKDYGENNEKTNNTQ
jgi:hypothetical protein